MPRKDESRRPAEQPTPNQSGRKSDSRASEHNPNGSNATRPVKSPIVVISPYAPKLPPIVMRPDGDDLKPPPVLVARGLEASYEQYGIVHHILASVGLALLLGGAATVAQPSLVQYVPRPISRFIPPARLQEKPPESHSSTEGDSAKEIRELVHQIFEHFLEKSTDEAYEALQKAYEKLKRRRDLVTAEEREEFDRLPRPEKEDGYHIFRSLWTLFRPILCVESFVRAEHRNAAGFCQAAAKLLQDAGVLSAEIACMAPLVGMSLKIAYVRTLASCCSEQP